MKALFLATEKINGFDMTKYILIPQSEIFSAFEINGKYQFLIRNILQKNGYDSTCEIVASAFQEIDLSLRTSNTGISVLSKNQNKNFSANLLLLTDNFYIVSENQNDNCSVIVRASNSGGSSSFDTLTINKSMSEMFEYLTDSSSISIDVQTDGQSEFTPFSLLNGFTGNRFILFYNEVFLSDSNYTVIDGKLTLLDPSDVLAGDVITMFPI